MRFLPLLLVLVGGGLGFDKVGQSQAPNKGGQSQAPVTLTVSSTRVLASPGLGFVGTTQCDEKGDIFFLAGNPQTPVIYELLRDGSHQVYGLVGDDARDNYYVAFRADRDGKVSILGGENESHRPVIFRFGEDPTTSPTKTPLDSPPGMDAAGLRGFIQLRSGHFLLQGFFDEHAAAKDRGHSYLAEFDSSGTFVRTVTDKDKLADNAQDWAGHAPLLEGEDGSIYALLPDKVLVLSQTGKVARTIKLVPPVPDYLAFQAYLAGGRLAIGYYKGAAVLPAKLETLYAVLDAATGRQLRAYKPEPQLEGLLPVGFSDEGFVFYKVGEEGRINLLIARAD
jgi:hypothetical protein